MIDRQAGELSNKSLKFYRQFLKFFIEYCDANSLKQVRGVTADFLRRYLLFFAETHNPGGVHAAYRTLHAFFRWITEEEIMPPEWKNPMQKVKAPKVNIDPLEPISLDDVRKLIDTCQQGRFTGERDKSIFLFLLESGARAQEVCNTNINDVDLNTGSVMIRYGKGGKSRIVFMGRKRVWPYALIYDQDRINHLPYSSPRRMQSALHTMGYGDHSYNIFPHHTLRVDNLHGFNEYDRIIYSGDIA